MKTKTIIITLTVLLVLGGLLAWSYAKNGASASAVQGAGAGSSKSALTASETLYDFGTISMRDGNVEKVFTITNPTSQDITVNTVVTSCMCTAAFIVGENGSTKGPFGMPGHSGFVPPANEIIKAGESRVIRVVYDPNAHGPAGVGAIDRFVSLTDSARGTLQLEIKALVTP